MAWGDGKYVAEVAQVVAAACDYCKAGQVQSQIFVLSLCFTALRHPCCAPICGPDCCEKSPPNQSLIPNFLGVGVGAYLSVQGPIHSPQKEAF